MRANKNSIVSTGPRPRCGIILFSSRRQNDFVFRVGYFSKINCFSGLVIRMRYSEPCGRGFFATLRLGPPIPRPPLQAPAPAACRNAMTRRTTGLARVVRYAPKSPRVNFRQRTTFLLEARLSMAIARRGGRSPERSEGSSRSKSRAALVAQAGGRGCKRPGESRRPPGPCPRRASAVGGKAALRMKAATIGGQNDSEAKTVTPGGQNKTTGGEQNDLGRAAERLPDLSFRV